MEGALLGLGPEARAGPIGSGEWYGPKGGELGRLGAGRASRWFGPKGRGGGLVLVGFLGREKECLKEI